MKAPWDETVQDPVRRQFIDDFIATRNPQALQMYGEHLMDSGRVEFELYGQYVLDSIEFHNQFKCHATSDHNQMWRCIGPCRACDLKLSLMGYHQRDNAIGHPLQRQVARVRRADAARYLQSRVGVDPGRSPGYRQSRVARTILQWEFHMGVPAIVTGNGESIISLFSWLTKTMPIVRVIIPDHRTIPFGVGMDFREVLWDVWIPGIPGARTGMSQRDLDNDRWGGPSNDEIGEACLHAAFPGVDFEVRDFDLTQEGRWSIMDVVRRGGGRVPTLVNAPPWIDCGMEADYAEFR